MYAGASVRSCADATPRATTMRRSARRARMERELAAYLTRHPRCRATCSTGATTPVRGNGELPAAGRRGTDSAGWVCGSRPGRARSRLRSLFSPGENRHSSSLISSRGGDRELENEVRGENRRFRSRIGQRIDFVQRKAAHARRERNEQIEQLTTRQTAGLVPPDARRVCRIEHIRSEERRVGKSG